MLGLFVTNNGFVSIKGRSIKNKPVEPVFKHVGLSKRKYMKTLLSSYRIMNFTDFNILELSEISQKQWVNRKYPIPEGYMVKYGKTGTNFRKITQEDLIRNKIYEKKRDLKSDPFVK